MEFIIIIIILFTIKIFCTYVSKVQQKLVDVAAKSEIAERCSHISPHACE